MKEEWKDVVGYEGFYEVSSLGRVSGHKGNILKLTRAGKGHGHLAVGLHLNGKVKVRYVHHLVLESFISMRPGNLQGLHNNGKHFDNRLENLRWDTPSSNSFDKVKHGVDHETNKESCPRGHELKMPNLVPGLFAKSGHRSCLACARAHSFAYRKGLAFDPRVADQYHAQIQLRA